VWKVHEIAPSATSTQLVVHALLTDAPARRGGNLGNSCTQFPLETVIQLLKETGVDLPATKAQQKRIHGCAFVDLKNTSMDALLLTCCI